MKRLALTALIGVGLVGCAAEPVQLQHNRSYILEWIGERPLMDYSHLTVTLGDDGRAYGNGGCNHWFAPYTQDGDKLTFGKIGKTRKLCAPAVMASGSRTSLGPGSRALIGRENSRIPALVQASTMRPIE